MCPDFTDPSGPAFPRLLNQQSQRGVGVISSTLQCGLSQEQITLVRFRELVRDRFGENIQPRHFTCCLWIAVA